MSLTIPSPRASLMSFASFLMVNALQLPPNNIFKIPISKQHVPVMSDGKQVAVKTAYYGDIYLGGPISQYFTVVFDTGSGHLFIPSAKCNDSTCAAHRQFDYRFSATAVETNYDGSKPTPTRRDQVSIAYGTGEIAGEFVHDTVCLGFHNRQDPENFTDAVLPLNCGKARIIMARTMTDEPFSSFSFDGVLGLGLTSLALAPEFHVFEQLARMHHIAPTFSFYLSMADQEQSEITFGGYDAARAAAPLVHVPVVQPEQGFWRVPIKGLRLGNETLTMCNDGTCSAILDTGTSLLGVPSESYNELILGTARQLTDEIIERAKSKQPGVAADDYIGGGLDCRYVDGPPLIFDMGEIEVVIEAQDYTRPVLSEVVGFNESEPNVTHSVCRASLLPIDMPDLGGLIFVWGEPVLKKYYTSYDLAGQRVGVARAVHPTGVSTNPSRLVQPNSAQADGIQSKVPVRDGENLETVSVL